MLLAELGHEVVRVELPERHVGAPTAVLDESEEAFLHRRKKSIELPELTWSSEFLALASAFDAVVEDFGPGALGGLGITVHRLRELNRNLVVASISPLARMARKRSGTLPNSSSRRLQESSTRPDGKTNRPRRPGASLRIT